MLRRANAIGLIAVLLGLCVLTACFPEPETLRGTWVLHQVDSHGALERDRAMLDRALATPGIEGFTMRVPWSAIDNDLSLVDAGLALARAHNVNFSVRFMAGRHTPAHVIDRGPWYTTADGARVPLPFTPDGGPNSAFEEEYELIVGLLADWARRNEVELLHLPWWGQDWAEINHGREVRAAPGYSYEAWLAAHTRLIDRAKRSALGDLVLEWPLSGYGPLSPAGEDLARHLVAVYGENADGVVVQANGWDGDGVWGSPTAAIAATRERSLDVPLRRAFQSIHPQATSWRAAYALARARGALYVEVYAQSFFGADRDALVGEIRPGEV